MPCTCWYNPSNEEQKKFKELCQELVNLIQEVHRKGDAMGTCTIDSAHKLLDHLYTGKCDEKPKEEK